jgi:hypothetical protein
MGRWVGLAPSLVVGCGDDFILMHNHCTDRNLVRIPSINRQIVGVSHKKVGALFECGWIEFLERAGAHVKNQAGAFNSSVGKGLFLACVMRVILFI